MILLKGGYLIDPLSETVSKGDVLISEGKIKRIGNISRRRLAKIIDIEGKFISPGIVDIHVHTRVPGKEYAEDFFSVSRCALRGGITSIVSMPNTLPVVDDINVLKKVVQKARKTSYINIFFASAITEEQAGKNLVDIDAMARYVVCFSDDGKWVVRSNVMLKAMEKAFRYGKRIFSHSQLPCDGVVNLGNASRRFGIKGMDPKSEWLGVWRDCLLAVVSGIPLHLQHISSLYSVEIIKLAKRLNPNITAETCPHYLWFCEDDVLDANFKMNPPLRTKDDVLAVINGVKDGVIDVIASDHAPHSKNEKELSLDKAPFGIIGLETLLCASIDKLYIEHKMPLPKVIKKLTLNPSWIIGFNGGILREGIDACLCVFSFDGWRYDKTYSKSMNSPFLGKRFKTKIEMTFVNGKILYDNGRFYI